MLKKFVKDRAHNRHEAYCCDDIDPRIEALEAAVAALVAGTVPDGSVTLAKLAADARTYTREINKGALISEWIGTEAEYALHLAENGEQPLANVKYSITDKPLFEWREIAAINLSSSNNSIDIELDANSYYMFEIEEQTVGKYVRSFMLSTKVEAGAEEFTETGSPVFYGVGYNGTEWVAVFSVWGYSHKSKKLYFSAFDHTGATPATYSSSVKVRYAKITE